MLTLNNLKISSKSLGLAGISSILLIAASAVNAQSVPSAGSLLQQIEKDFKPQLPSKSAPQFLAPPPMQSMGGEKVQVKLFRFAGNTLLSNSQLESVVADFLNRPLDFATLQNVAVQVAAAYRQAGWVVRAYLPQQDIVDGLVTIQVVEAVLGAVRTEGAMTRVAASQVKALVETNQPVGSPLNGDSLDRALLLIDDLPGITSTGRLSEGKNQGETDLILAVSDSQLIGGDVAADNTGSRSTGAERLAANVTVSSPAGLGDLASASLIHTEGSDYLRAAYTLPVGSSGWRLGLNASHLSYQVLTSGLTQADGTSSTTGFEASYPLLRSRMKNAYLLFGLDQKTFDNRNGGAVTTQYKSQVASLTVNGNVFDNLGGGGATNASVSLAKGHLNLAGSPNEAADAASTQTAGSFEKVRFAAARQQVLTQDLSFYASIAGQRASKNLDSSEKFYLGGAGGVRAYPSSEGGGSEGHILNLELRMRLPDNFSVIGFYDHGSVAINKNNSIVGAVALNSYDLKGVGVSVGWTASFGLTVKATLAHRIGDNPNPTSTGTDQDGSLTKNRFWLQASLPL
jgi:hemolysin activation/secretion protein